MESISVFPLTFLQVTLVQNSRTKSSYLSLPNWIFRSAILWYTDNEVFYRWYDFFIIHVLKLICLFQRLLRPSPQTWNLIPIDYPEHHYGRRGRDDAFKQKAGFTERLFAVPKLLLHNLICTCYVCTNPVVIPLVLRFLFLQVSFSSHSWF